KMNPEYKRLAFSAVPLDPWTAKHPLELGTPYYIASLDHIDKIVSESFELSGGFGLGHELEELVKVSLWSAQSQRLQYNHDNPVPLELRAADVRVERACQGYASPEEVLDIFLDHPEFHALELAKLTHPFDYAAADEMTERMTRVLDERLGARPPVENPHYKLKRKELDTQALVLARKASTNINVNGEQLCVVERKSFLLRGDAGAVSNYDIDRQKRHVRLVMNDERLDELTGRVEVFLSQGETPPRWLQPLTTSYYIYRVTPES
ncbi:MAG: hypothetical protein ACMG55_19520, partial [Microcoleus sp.]